jgi:heat shock protein beta
MSANQERISRAQAFASKDQFNNSNLARKTFEINPNHPTITNLLNRVKDLKKGERDEVAEDTAVLLHDSALINTGFVMEDPSDFANKVNRITRRQLNIDLDAKIKE